MATEEAESQGVVAFVGALWRQLLIVVFTGVETVALVGWLFFVDDAALVSLATALGLAILAGGLLVEHFLTDLAVSGLDLSFPFSEAVAFTVTETALWALWLLIAERVGGLGGLLVAGTVLALLLIPQHAFEDNVLRGRGLFASVLTRGTVGFSIIEAAGATLWLLLVQESALFTSLLRELGLSGIEPGVVGIGILAVALFVEHNIGVAFARRPVRD